MGAFRVTGNLLMSFALYWGIVALLYGGKDVTNSIGVASFTPAPYGKSSVIDTAEHFSGTDMGKV